MTAPPRVIGDRLGLVVGSGMGDVLGAGDAFVVDVEGWDGTSLSRTFVDHGQVVVLRRHGDGTPAHLIDHHANVRALCAAGCDRVVALSSTGGLRPELTPGTIVAPHDVLALTTYPSFHDDSAGYGVRGFDASWRETVIEAWRARATSPIVDGGTYAMTAGPRFETPAEVRMLAAFADVVGMTVAAECFLAAEAGLRHMAICKIDNLANGLVPGEDTMAALSEHVEHSAAQFASDVAAVVSGLL